MKFQERDNEGRGGGGENTFDTILKEGWPHHMDSILKGQGPLEESLIIKGQFKLDPGQVGDAGFRVLGNTRGISKTPIKLIKDLLLLIFKPHLGPNVPTAFIP